MKNKNNKEIRQRRMMKLFMEATQEIIEKEGIENATIRKISELAGYNSSTIYNYFENVEKLISFTLIKIVMEYFNSLYLLGKKENKSYIRFLLTWREYASFSFEKPEIYKYVFYSEHTYNILNMVNSYLDWFPSNILSESDEIAQKVLGKSINSRDDLILIPCIRDGYFDENNKKYISNFCYTIHLGMCEQIKISSKKDIKAETELFMDYLISFLLTHSKIPEKKEILLQTIMNYKISN